MLSSLPQLLNVKKAEIPLVRKLFFIQFLLGIATSFLFVSTLTLFLLQFNITNLPKVYILSGVLLVGFNFIYGYMDERMSAKRLLQYVIIFSAVSVLVLRGILAMDTFIFLPFLLAAWYMIIYMISGYAFWAVAAVLFNVRESKRLFSIVGAGDIPAKMLGYLSITILVPLIGVANLLWVSVIAFVAAYAILYRFTDAKGIVSFHENEKVAKDPVPKLPKSRKNVLLRLLPERLVPSIALLSVIAYIVFALIDFTFLSEVKLKYQGGSEIATFVAFFFAFGRVMALLIKIFFSSRVIANLGLVKTLLIIPLMLLFCSIFILLAGDAINSPLYIFGAMVLISEVLRSTLYEPVYFILFQPLRPHDRLRGHLIAKGHTMPLALLPVGVFLLILLEDRPGIDINFIATVLIALFIIWIAVIFLIRKNYFATLVNSIKKGYFFGKELFLKDEAIITLLLQRVQSNRPVEIINSLSLLERSSYAKIDDLLLDNLESQIPEVRRYSITRIIDRKLQTALPKLERLIANETEDDIKQKHITALYLLQQEDISKLTEQVEQAETHYQQAAFTGLLLRDDLEVNKQVQLQLISIIHGNNDDRKLLVLNVFADARLTFPELLRELLRDPSRKIVRRAIEVAGICKCIEVVEDLFSAAATHGLWASLQSAIVNYGDSIFQHPSVTNARKEAELKIITSAAGKISGVNSTNYLSSLLRTNITRGNEVIDALWRKKSVLSSESKAIIEQYASGLLQNAISKSEYLQNLSSDSKLHLVEEALRSEIRQDLLAILKGFTFRTDGDKFARVIDLLKMRDQYRIANAIETLEMIMTKKQFLMLNSLIETANDPKAAKTEVLKKKEPSGALIEHILFNQKPPFNLWTRSISCYLLPLVSPVASYKPVLEKLQVADLRLLAETKEHILSVKN